MYVGSGGLTESEKEFICKDENYSDPPSTRSDEDIPFTIAYYRSYYINCTGVVVQGKTMDKLENFPIRLEFNMFN